MQPLTKRQREILDYLQEFIQQHGYAPSLEEIGRRFSLSSLATVHKHLTNLEEKGFIRRSWNRSRSVELLSARTGHRAIELPLLGYVAAGAPIEAVASAYPSETFKGKVVSVDSHIDPTTRSVNVRAIVSNPDLRLRSGMLMRVDLIKDQRDSLVIPEAALQPENDKQYVFVVGANNVAKRTLVTIGRRRMGSVEILDGLKDGDWIIKEGMQDLRTGAKVNVVNAGELKTQPAREAEEMTRPE